MITRIDGVLEAIEGGAARIRPAGGLVYEVLLPGYAAARLGGKIGRDVSLHTLEFIEAPQQGAIMTPRLAGFLSERDRRFFALFTTVKGIGLRKALRCMTLDTPMLASAIADRDAAMLCSLPEIGKRSAETIIVTLKDKVDAFVEPAGRAVEATSATSRRGKAAGMATDAASTGGDGEPLREGSADTPTAGGSGRLAREAIEVLVRLGENRAQAATWVDRVLQDAADRPTDASELVARVYEAKAGA